jgi:hypothetical protein
VPGFVVVGQHPGGRGTDGDEAGDAAVDDVAQGLGMQGAFEEVEVEGGVQFVRPQVLGEAGGTNEGLGDENAGVG